jgi:hypothetical protein
MSPTGAREFKIRLRIVRPIAVSVDIAISKILGLAVSDSVVEPDFHPATSCFCAEYGVTEISLERETFPALASNPRLMGVGTGVGTGVGIATAVGTGVALVM